MKTKLSVFILALGLATAFQSPVGSRPTIHNTESIVLEGATSTTAPSLARRDIFVHGFGLLVGSLVAGPLAASADVSDGNMLPQGAAQFSRVLRLQSDLKSVKKRAVEGGSDIDDKEWNNVGRFLRMAYSTGDDMKAIAGGIADADRKKRAMDAIELLKKYAQAGDMAVNKRDPSGLAAVLDKMSGLVSDFLDSLSDVPDEL